MTAADLARTDVGAEQIVPADERSKAVDRLGNLTLVTPSFNRSVSNLGWAVKRPEFENQRSLVINYDIAHSETWDEESIASRAKQLAAVANKVWPSAESLLNATSN